MIPALVSNSLPPARRHVNGNELVTPDLPPKQRVVRQKPGGKRYLVELGGQISGGYGMADVRSIFQHFFQNGRFGVDGENNVVYVHGALLSAFE